MISNGCVLFFTGLSGAGKSTIAEALKKEIEVRAGRYATLLDGDIVRNLISSELGFSKEDRDMNIRRIGYIAKEIANHRGMVICAAIAPYEAVREEIRASIGCSRFVLIHVATPLSVCELRDVKGLYKQVRAGKIKNFTGVTDPYEIPNQSDITLDTTGMSVDACVTEIMRYLERNDG